LLPKKMSLLFDFLFHLKMTESLELCRLDPRTYQEEKIISREVI
jgi:hypothetical protein